MKTNMLRKISLFLFVVLLFAVPSSLAAADFGILLNQNLGFGGEGGDTAVDYSASLAPRLSFLIGDSSEFYMSASAAANYENEDWKITPELLRTDITWRRGSYGIRAGRMIYSDPLGFIASGLFDGARFSHDSDKGTFSAGVWYTGLLYKKSAYIAMTPEDETSYSKELDYGDFFDTYFASRRVLGALGWEHPVLAGIFRVKFAALGQADLNGEDSAFHSQYLAGKIGVPVENFIFDLGGTFEIAEIDGGDDSGGDGIKFAWAGEAGVSWFIPTVLQDQLSFTGRLASGGTDGDVIAFAPLSTKLQGNILKAKFSGLSVLSLAYTARLHPAFSAALNASYFMRTDLATYKGYPVSDDKGHLLGSELFARFFWSPVSDIRVTAGGGVFLPSLGNAGKDAEPSWRVELGASLALF